MIILVMVMVILVMVMVVSARLPARFSLSLPPPLYLLRGLVSQLLELLVSILKLLLKLIAKIRHHRVMLHALSCENRLQRLELASAWRRASE
jgi:hypothetical protein